MSGSRPSNGLMEASSAEGSSSSLTAAPAGSKIKTIVVLVQENRSFDHILGWFKRINAEIDGLTGTESNPLSTSDPSSGLVTVSDGAEYVDPDPGHSYGAILEQVFGDRSSSSSNPAPMNGFAQQAESTQKGLSQRVMSAFDPDMLPAYKSLVAEFGICDRWFASVPASTQPNRLFVHSATSHGDISNDTQHLVLGFPQKTIFESVGESGLTWGVYFQIIPSTLFFRNLRTVGNLANFHAYDDFKTHAKEGKLPNYTVIEQRWFDTADAPGNDDHPSHNVALGQQFIAEVYKTLRSSPQWNELLWVITYDEHGGYYDHVPTPMNNVPNPDGRVGTNNGTNFQFDRLGVRVPAIFVSPWIEKSTVLHTPDGPTPDSQFEHSSIPATVKKLFNLNQDFLTKRDAWAGTFDGILSSTMQEPRKDCPMTLPTPSVQPNPQPNDKKALSEFQGELVELASHLLGDFAAQDAKCLSCFGFRKDHLSMNIREARQYTEKAVSTVLDARRAASEAGAEPDKVIQCQHGCKPGKPKYILI